MKWAQHHTAQLYAELMVRQMAPLVQLDSDSLWGIELGAGHGALLAPAARRWSWASLLAIDICSDSLAQVKRLLPKVSLRRMDLLDPRAWGRDGLLADLLGSRDIALCNPPFQSLANCAAFRALCARADMPECAKLPRVNAALVFLLHNICLLKHGGVMGIILPDGLLTGKSYAPFRHDLLHQHRLEALIQLPDNAFAGIEARTHILLLRKALPKADKVSLWQSAVDGELSQSLLIDSGRLTQRMDYSYWRYGGEHLKSSLSLADIGADIRRGTRSKRILQDLGLDFVHSSDLPNQASSVRYSMEPSSFSYLRAGKGDILITRVGKRCLGRVALVEAGDIPISDCVLRVRVPSRWVKPVWRALTSDQAQDWFAAHAHGTCAQVISKADLLNFPIEQT